MSTFSWLGAIEELSPTALTVRAQTISPNDNGALLWDIFMPRRDVDSVELEDVTTLDYRPAADRREWNGRGRYIPVKTPDTRTVSVVPIEAYDKIDEYEMQRLNERALGNSGVIQRLIGTSLPARVDRLAESVYRRLELDFVKAWTDGQIVQRNPQNGATYTASFGLSATRLTTALTAWNDGGVNAYDLFLTWYNNALDLAGPGEGVMLRQATFNAIQADAPNVYTGTAVPRLTRRDLEARIQDETGAAFRFYINENSVDVFDDGGTAITRTKVWPAQHVAYIPAGRRVGNTAFAPVVRAMDMSAAGGAASVDVRGLTVFYDAAGAGRDLTIEAQANAVPVPDEQKVVVIDAGV
jgi:hypothetical protein